MSIPEVQVPLHKQYKGHQNLRLQTKKTKARQSFLFVATEKATDPTARPQA